MNRIFLRRGNNSKRTSSKKQQAPHHQLSPSFSSPEPLHLKLNEDVYQSSKGPSARSPIADTFLSSTSRAEDSSIQSAIPNSSLFDDILHELSASRVSSPPLCKCTFGRVYLSIINMYVWLASIPLPPSTSSQVASNRSRQPNESHDSTLNRQTQQQQLQHPALFPSTMTGTQATSDGSSSSSSSSIGGDEKHHHYDNRDSSDAPVATLVPPPLPPSRPNPPTGNTKSVTTARMHKSMLPAFKHKSRSIPDSDASDSDAGSSTTAISSVEDASQSSQKQIKHKSDPHILSPEVVMGRMKERHRQECRRSWQYPLPPSPQQHRPSQMMQYRNSPSMPTIYPLDSLVHPHMTHSESFSPSTLHAARASPSPEPSASYQLSRQPKRALSPGMNVTSMPTLDMDYTRSPLPSHQHYHPTTARAHLPSSPSMLRYQQQQLPHTEKLESGEVNNHHQQQQQQRTPDLTEQPLRRTVCWTDSVGQQPTTPKRGRSLPNAFASQPAQTAQASEAPDSNTKPTPVHSHQLLPPTPPPDLSQQHHHPQKDSAVRDTSAMRQSLLSPKPLDELDAFRHSLPDLAVFAAEDDDEAMQHVSRRASKSMSNLNAALDKAPLKSDSARGVTEDAPSTAPVEVPGIQYDPQQHQLVTLTEMPTILVNKDKQTYHILIPNTAQAQQTRQHHCPVPVCAMPAPSSPHCHYHHHHHHHTPPPLALHSHCGKHAAPPLCSNRCPHQEQRKHEPQEEQQHICPLASGHCKHHLMHRGDTPREHRCRHRSPQDASQPTVLCGYQHPHHPHQQHHSHHHRCRHKNSAGRSRHHRHHHDSRETTS